MARIEVYFEFGKLLGMIQKLRPPQFVTLFRNEAGEMLPIYEGNNEVPPGQYEIYTYQPFKTNGDRTERAGWVTVNDDAQVVYILVMSITGTLSAFARNSESEWNKYIQPKGDRVQRYIGWRADQATRMINF